MYDRLNSAGKSTLSQEDRELAEDRSLIPVTVNTEAETFYFILFLWANNLSKACEKIG